MRIRRGKKKSQKKLDTKKGTWKEKDTKTVSLKCAKCGKTGENYVLGGFSGLHLGLRFMPKHKHLGKKDYVLCCPICGYYNKSLSVEELQELKRF